MKTETKICSKCNKEFPNTDKYFPHYAHNICRTCKNIEHKKYFRSINGLISKMYNSQKRLSKIYDYKFPFYSKQEFKDWVINQPIFDKLLNDYIESNYNRDLSPCAIRIDKTKPFKFDNLRLCTWKEGRDYSFTVKKHNSNRLAKYDADGVLIASYDSIAQLYRESAVEVTYESFKSKLKNRIRDGKEFAGGFWEITEHVTGGRKKSI